ncbi:MAG: tail fiber domain-containing protein [candidate division Zixibacteria bacterium]|nr:tail fiber domain-containing protein [candidate division Zixibacteria bacterium]
MSVILNVRETLKTVTAGTHVFCYEICDDAACDFCKSYCCKNVDINDDGYLQTTVLTDASTEPIDDEDNTRDTTNTFMRFWIDGEEISPTIPINYVFKARFADGLDKHIHTNYGRAFITNIQNNHSGGIDIKSVTNGAVQEFYPDYDSGASNPIMSISANTNNSSIAMRATLDGGISFDSSVWNTSSVLFNNSTGSLSTSLGINGLQFNQMGDTGFFMDPSGYGFADGPIGIGTYPSFQKSGEMLTVNGIIYSLSGGFKFPDGTLQTTASGSGNWSLSSNVLYTTDKYGVAKGNASNILYGDSAYSHVNLGIACTTGVSTSARYYPSVGGGKSNVAAGNYSTIAGGYSNYTSSAYGTIGGGYNNLADDNYTSITGGRNNIAGAEYSTVTGGYGNEANDLYAFVGGGENNEANARHTTVCGGESNIASAWYSTVCGGWKNISGDLYATISGGYNNVIGGHFSVIPCGRSINIGNNASYSMAFGDSVVVTDSFRVILFEGTRSGRLGVNRDDDDGSVSYPIHVGTSTSNGNGAHLTAGGTWTNGSSRAFKENFRDLDGREVLRLINEMPIQSWTYKDTDEKHIGPVAEDFQAAFDIGTVDENGWRENKYLAASDVAGVALIGVKELYSIVQQIEIQSSKIEKLEAELARINTLLNKLAARNENKSPGSENISQVADDENPKP